MPIIENMHRTVGAWHSRWSVAVCRSCVAVCLVFLHHIDHRHHHRCVGLLCFDLGFLFFLVRLSLVIVLSLFQRKAAFLYLPLRS